ncbi:MAG: pyruvate, phosphate dikinase [Desulfobacteraceae bacterium]|nr:pyruvate, phosphate dikinase [Desulfobacteraceae bacterium]
MKSKALEVNLSDTKIDVSIDKKYKILQDIACDYLGVLNRMNSFLKELSHPYINFEFIVKETRHFSLHYFYLYKNHNEGDKALKLFIEIFFKAFEATSRQKIKFDAVANLMLLLQHVLKEPCENKIKFTQIVGKVIKQIHHMDEKKFYYFARCYYQPGSLVKLLINTCNGTINNYKFVNLFLKTFYEFSLSYFLIKKDPLAWMNDDPDIKNLDQKIEKIVMPVSHSHLNQLKTKLQEILKLNSIESKNLTEKLLELPGHMDLVNRFRSIPQKLSLSMPDENKGKRLKLIFLFYIIHISSLEMIHEEALREINRTLTSLIGDKNFKNDQNMIDKTFKLLKNHTGTYPSTVLDCIQSVGQAVYKTKEIELINYFIDHVIDLGFQFPAIKGTGEDWQIKGNNAHIKNIRTFLQLICQNPKLSARLFSALIISLSIGGVFIKDTDLFPRDITKLLNSDIEPAYNHVKQLARLLPSFFNEIGAEGKLRDISTKLDEACLRKDILIHFLRKQSHVESSSRVVQFMEEVFVFWKTGKKEKLKPFVPPSIFDKIDSDGIYVDGLRTILNKIDHKGFCLPQDYLLPCDNIIFQYIDQVNNVSSIDKSRVKLAIDFYKLLNQKYNFDNVEFINYLSQLRSEKLPDTKNLLNALASNNIKRKISVLLGYAEKLKTIILSQETFEPEESIYNKRHFAIDIPSMYGSYHEVKFDALGLMLRIENIVNVLFEELVENADLHLMTKATFAQIFQILKLFSKALKLDGIISNKMTLQLEFLHYSIEIKECSFTQYRDIFRGFSSAVRDMINDNFNNIHAANFMQIGSNIKQDQILDKFLSQENFNDKNKFIQRAAEIFFRDRIVTTLGLQQLDVFLNKILHTLFIQSEDLSLEHINKLLNYDPKNAVSQIDGSVAMGSNIIFLGNKGLNLIKMKNMNFPVPSGFIVTTEVFRCLEIIDNYKPATKNFKQNVLNELSHLEKIVGKSFGSLEKPLLLSIRSGSSISQPGMMDSFLNVGMNEKITVSMAKITKNPWFAWDCYRRFLQGYGMAFNINRNEFDNIINSFKNKFSKKFKKEFTDIQMKTTALAYKQIILDHGVIIQESPIDQLYLAISKVFESWESARAKNYRRIMGISDDWGTAVTIQEMVFGNKSIHSGSGVVLSHSPRLPGDTIRLWGDFTIGNQGEDVVSGLVKTLPISEMQREIEKRDTDISLELFFPKIYLGLKKMMHKLIYNKGWNPQEIEFTFEGIEQEDLHLLQTRDMSLREQKILESFDVNIKELDKVYLSRGIGVSGGAMSGRAVFSIKEINQFRKKDPKMPLIILREDTVPDDILEIDAADGILTARGGVTSHAAIVAYSLGKTCVVGCENLVCDEKEKTCILNGTKLISGDYISINGMEGSVYKGLIKINNQL